MDLHYPVIAVVFLRKLKVKTGTLYKISTFPFG